MAFVKKKDLLQLCMTYEEIIEDLEGQLFDAKVDLDQATRAGKFYLAQLRDIHDVLDGIPFSPGREYGTAYDRITWMAYWLEIDLWKDGRKQ